MSQVWNDNTYDASGHQITVDMQAIEDNFACLKSMFSGASAPSDPVAGMIWLDTTNHILKQRNEANNAWISIFNLSTGIILLSLGSGVVAAAQLVSDAVETAKIKDGQVTAGKIYDGAITTTKIADANVTGRKLPNVIASTIVTNSYSQGAVLCALSTRGTTNTSYTKLKQFTINRAGTYRVISGLASTIEGYTVYSKVYKNGSPVGIEWYTDSASGITCAESLAFAVGDTCELWAKRGTYSCTANVSGFLLQVTDPLWGSVDTD